MPCLNAKKELAPGVEVRFEGTRHGEIWEWSMELWVGKHQITSTDDPANWLEPLAWATRVLTEYQADIEREMDDAANNLTLTRESIAALTTTEATNDEH